MCLLYAPIFHPQLQQQTSGLFQQSEETYLQGALLMALSAMVQGSLYLVEWWSMANIPMNFMNYKLLGGNGNASSLNLQKLDLLHVPD